MPSGTAGAATATAAATGCPSARRCHIAIHARYGAAARRNHKAPTAPGQRGDQQQHQPYPGPPGQKATAPSQAATIGRHHAAAAYTRRGGHPCHHAYQKAPAATTVTGANATARPTTVQSRISKPNPRHSAARTGR